ncbi:MAG: hypothetical protein AB7O29_08825 [Acidimicrobiia bacterium]
MSTRLSRAFTGAVVTLAGALVPAHAFAGPGIGGGGGSGGTGSEVDGAIIATVTYATGGGGGGSCVWERVEGELGVEGMGSAVFPYTRDGITYNLWRATCPDEVIWRVIPETDPDDLLPRLLEDVKSTRLPQPEPTFFAVDPAQGWAYVTVPLDFRVGGNAWRTVSVTASLGPVWATVTAVPTRLTFDSGDPNGPGLVTCAGDAPLAGYDPAWPGECSYTYRNASSTSPFDGYHFETTTSIDWSISWTSSTGAGGPLEPYSTSASALLAVAEVKGLVTCTGSRAEQGGC